MPYALCPMPYALCPMPYARLSSVYLMLLKKAIYVENQAQSQEIQTQA